MEWLDPIRDLIHPHQAKQLNARLPSVELRVQRRESARGNFYFPAPKITAQIRARDAAIGLIEFGVNPLSDRLYVNLIEVERTYRHQGYGLATLWALHLLHGLPIVPLCIWGTAYPFWESAGRQLKRAGVSIEPELRVAHLDQEQQRWAHLVPEPEHQALIREIEASPEWPAIQAAWAAREQS